MKAARNFKNLVKTGLFAILLLLPLLSMAQKQKRSAEQRARMATDALKTTCSLTEDQYKLVYQANLDFVNRAATLRSDTDDQMVKMGKLKLADNERDQAMKSIMDNHQYKAFQTWKEERRQKMQRFNKG